MDYLVNLCSNSLKILKENNFHPIAISQMFFEEVYVFKTEEEAIKGFNQFEKCCKTKKNQIYAWWYGKAQFLKAIEHYKRNYKYYPKILWRRF